MKKTVFDAPNYINHIGLVLDASGSMQPHEDKLIEIADNQIKHLATRSQELDQETRISVWVFSGWNEIRCVVWDKDVLRLPSIKRYYKTMNMTALVDAAMQSISDMETTSQIHGDHSFLLYFLTDGVENDSRKYRAYDLSDRLSRIASQQNTNWTFAALVPDMNAVFEAKKLGFPAGNIQTWDISSTAGLEKAGESILRSADAYMTARSTGLRSTTALFDMSATAVNKATIKAAGLKPLDTSEYVLVPVIFPVPFQDGDDRIDNFTERMGYQYVARRGFYQLSSKPVVVQANKEIAVVERKSNKVYTGKNARALLGLPDMNVTLKAGDNPEYDIFIQSTSLNRKLLIGTKYLYLTPVSTYVRPAPAPAPRSAARPKSVAGVARPAGQQARQANGRFAAKV